MAKHVEVKSELLRWAIERSGLPVDAFKQPVEDWLTQEAKPTHSKLEAFAKKAMVPLGYLFLSKPPEENLPVPDYRTRDDDGVRRPSPNLLETIFDMQRRLEWMREYLLDAGHEPLPFIGSAKIGDDPAQLANRIRDEINITADWAHKTGSIENALRLLRKQIEDSGILIFINGVVGNATRRVLDVEEFQGFVLADDVAPLIFVNGADYKAAQFFTIAHELVHLWLGKGALFDNLAMNDVDVEVETYCNSVAAELLVPAKLIEPPFANARRIDDADFKTLARLFKVSPIVIARRASELGFISKERFFRFYRHYIDEVRKAPKKKSKGGNFWKTQNTRLGSRFGRAVISAAKEGKLPYTEAYGLTRLYGKTFDKYASLLSKEGG